MTKVQAIPDGFRSVTPHIVVAGGEEAIAFYAEAFGAECICKMLAPDGEKIMHAELQIGDSRLMLCDEFPEMGGDLRSPASLGASTVSIHLYVTDVDQALKVAEAAGASVIMPAVDMFWGDRYAKVRDPFGHSWSIATHIVDKTPEEIDEAAKNYFSGGFDSPSS